MPYRNLNIYATACIGMITSSITSITLEDLNTVLSIAVQIIIGLVTIFRIVKTKKQNKRDKQD